MVDDIQLRWNGSTFEGYDPAQSEVVPVPFSTIDTDEARADREYITKQDLSALNSSEKEDAYVYHHDGSSAISVSSGTTSASGYYFWDAANSYWKPLSNGGGSDGGLNVVASGTVTLSSGAAVVSTGVTTTPEHFDIYLDPAGGGANSSGVKAAARAYWDNSGGEYKIEILEDGTSVGNPDIGYKVVTA